MKRSEMQSKVTALIDKEMLRHHSYEFADLFLKLVESEGMSPPLYAPDDVGLVWGDEAYCEPNGFKIQVPKWAPEDAKVEIVKQVVKRKNCRYCQGSGGVGMDNCRECCGTGTV